jgi:hypothetical protein
VYVVGLDGRDVVNLGYGRRVDWGRTLDPHSTGD